MNINSEIANFTTFGGDGDNAFGRTRTIKHYGRRPFQKRNLVYLVREHVVRIAYHTVYDNEVFGISPDVSVETAHHIVYKAKTIACICFL